MVMQQVPIGDDIRCGGKSRNIEVKGFMKVNGDL
jgi:hypothetical protein